MPTEFEVRLPGPLVLYHADCPDGFAAAWVAHMEICGGEYRAVQYNQPPPDVANRHVFILDFAYPRDVLLDMHQKAKSLTVLDHHKTHQEELADLPFARFDLTKSGARLAWDYFFPGQMVPPLVAYVEDRDLWRWQMLGSKEFSACLASYPRTFDVWDRLHERMRGALPPQDFINEGAAILRYQQQLVEKIVKHARRVPLDGYEVLAVNSCVLQSEVGEALAQNEPFGVVWFINPEGKRVVSLRSRAPKGVDVAELARQHPGGGGHAQAAGFSEEGYAWELPSGLCRTREFMVVCLPHWAELGRPAATEYHFNRWDPLMATCVLCATLPVEGRHCAREACHRPLHPRWPAVYCSNVCALEDA